MDVMSQLALLEAQADSLVGQVRVLRAMLLAGHTTAESLVAVSQGVREETVAVPGVCPHPRDFHVTLSDLEKGPYTGCAKCGGVVPA